MAPPVRVVCRLMAALPIALVFLQGTECFSLDQGTKQCMKREQIAHREGNFYECPDPAYTECCEVNKRFTCCTTDVNKTIRDQLMVWGLVVVMALMGVVMYRCLFTDSVCNIHGFTRRLLAKRHSKKAEAATKPSEPPTRA